MQSTTNTNNVTNMVRELAQEILVIAEESQTILSTGEELMNIGEQVLATSQEMSDDMKHGNILGMMAIVPQIEQEVLQGVGLMQEISNGLKHIAEEIKPIVEELKQVEAQLKQMEAQFEQAEEAVVEKLHEWHLEL